MKGFSVTDSIHLNPARFVSLRKMCGKKLHLVGLLLFLLFGVSCTTQKKKQNPYGISTTTDFYNAEKYEAKRKKQLRYLYTYSMKDVLYGNPCVSEVTRSYGFEYIPAFDSPDEPRNDLSIWVHNLATSVAISFRHGIFWKRKVKKRIRFCAENSGDFNG
jgi:hypothetical protein